MIRKYTIVCAFVSLSGVACAAAPVGLVGYYSALHYVAAAAVAGGAGRCYDTQGSYYTSSIYYPGPGKPGTVDRQPINQSSFFGESISTLPVEPAAGVTHWAGMYSFRFVPAGPLIKASFSADSTIFDAHSSTSVFTYSYPAPGGGTCTETQHINYTFSGH